FLDLFQFVVASTSSARLPYTPLFRSRGLMWQHVGLVRDERGLEHALAELDCLEHEAGASERILLLAARLIATAALERAESRGGRSEEHTSELQSRENLVCRLLLEKT